MTQPPARLVRLFAVALTAASLAACGGSDDDSDTPAPGPAPAPSPGPAPAPAPAGAPSALDDAATGEVANGVRQPVTVNVLANDRAGSAAIDRGSVRIEGAGGNGRALAVAGQGNWTVNNDGSIRFTPQAGTSGNVTPIRYTVADTVGRRSNSAQVAVSYSASGGDGGNGGDASTSAACNNDAMWRAGSTWSVSWRSTGPSGSDGTETVEVIGQTSFRGRPAVEQRHTWGELISTTYSALNGGYEEFYGGNANTPGAEHYFDPAMRWPYVKQRGQTYTSSFNNHQGGAVTPTTLTLTYEGRETITVPAGTFETCRMRSTAPDQADVGPWFTWFIAGGPYRGIAIKDMSYLPDGSVDRGSEATSISASFR